MNFQRWPTIEWWRTAVFECNRSTAMMRRPQLCHCPHRISSSWCLIWPLSTPSLPSSPFHLEAMPFQFSGTPIKSGVRWNGSWLVWLVWLLWLTGWRWCDSLFILIFINFCFFYFSSICVLLVGCFGTTAPRRLGAGQLSWLQVNAAPCTHISGFH